MRIKHGQILYDFWGICTVDFHIELYNKLVSCTKNDNDAVYGKSVHVLDLSRIQAISKTSNEFQRIDDFLDDKSEKYCKNDKDGKRVPISTTDYLNISLPTFIRHQIDHGDNPFIDQTPNAIIMRKYKEIDLENSVKIMRLYF